MTSLRLVFRSALGLFFSWAFARPAHAESSVGLEYRAPPDCPSQADFVAGVAARGGRFESAEAATRLRGIDVSIRRVAQSYEGALRLEANGGSSAVREVHAEACSEVANGLAIVAAIALSGASQESAPEAASEQRPIEPLATPPKPAPPPTPTPVPQAASETKPRLTANSFKRDALVQVGPGTLRFDRIRTYALGAGVDFGLLPGLVVPRYEFAASVANLVTPPSLASYLVGPILEVHWSWLGPGTIHTQGFETRAFGLQAGVRSCSAFTYDTRGLTLLACGEFGVGWLKLRTKAPGGETVPEKETGFGTAGLGLHSHYSLGSLLQLDLRVGGRVQLGGMSAERADGSQIFAAPLFGGYALAGLGLQF